MYGSYEDEYRNTEGRDLDVSVDRVLKDDDDDEPRKVRRIGGRFLAIGAVVIILMAATVGVAVWLRQSNQETIPTGNAPIALSTLNQRNTVDDCWIAFYGNVYDMTQYNHPGPQALVTAYCGSDATAEYAAVHPEVYMRTIEHLYIGVYAESTSNRGDQNQTNASDESGAAPTVAPTTDANENQIPSNNAPALTGSDNVPSEPSNGPSTNVEGNENLPSISSTVVEDPKVDVPADTNDAEDPDDTENDTNAPVNNGGIFGNGGATQDEAPDNNSDTMNGDEMDDVKDNDREEDEGDNNDDDDDDEDEGDDDEEDDEEDEDREERTSNVRGEDVDKNKNKKKNKKKDKENDKKDKKKKKDD
ncbi:hypothetical protein FisN_26Hh134 [Fistulifera solaris]|uniref:Cytochrome b5 heme-binding domain-containing protein n=1 Tax=Fistulifera solaris TaxID=1519565 RepID=A0A1Z5JY84_FISSO|nr:hypothetical protein FisN_26Hh134 [Fistulifera solaris]|eukprot:GAX18832.1 hypothetical protein FisN_26Hh134 [Fistulifera solaris]